MKHNTTIKNLYVIIIFALLLSACGPKIARPKGIIPTPIFITNTNEIDPIKTQIEAIQSICLNVTQSGDMRESLQAMTEKALQKIGKQVVKDGCDASLDINAETKAIGNIYHGEGKSYTCYTGSSITAQVKLYKDSVILFENNNLSGGHPTTEGTITYCPETFQAPFVESVESLNNDLFVTIWGAGDTFRNLPNLSDEAIKDLAFLPNKAESVRYLLSLAKQDPTKEAIVITTLGSMGTDAIDAKDFLFDIAWSNDVEKSKMARSALTAILYNQTYGNALECEERYRIPQPADLDYFIGRISDPDQKLIDQIVYRCSFIAIHRLGEQAVNKLPELLVLAKSAPKTRMNDIYPDMVFYTEIFGDLGPISISAVPDILEYWSNETNCSNCQSSLEKITGQKLGDDPKNWISWWNEYVKGIK